MEAVDALKTAMYYVPCTHFLSVGCFVGRLQKGLAMPTVAMVAGTGFSTAKGELVRAILYPKPSSYDFEKKLYYFIANLVLFAAIACGITIAYQAGKVRRRWHAGGSSSSIGGPAFAAGMVESAGQASVAEDVGSAVMLMRTP